MCVSQRPKRKPRNGEQWFPTFREVQDKSHQASCWSLRGWDASCCVIIIGKEVKPSIATVCVLVSVFFDKDGLLLVDYPEKGATTTAKYYVALLNKLKQQLFSERRGKLSK
jgi:hypothetical protein